MIDTNEIYFSVVQFLSIIESINLYPWSFEEFYTFTEIQKQVKPVFHSNERNNLEKGKNKGTLREDKYVYSKVYCDAVFSFDTIFTFMCVVHFEKEKTRTNLMIQPYT